MKKYLLITLMAIALSATAQQTPTNKTRSNSDYSQVDNYLIGLKRLGIPTSETDNLDAAGLPQNTVKIIYNTTLGRLRIYNPLSTSWSDAGVSDLTPYYKKTQVDSLFAVLGENVIHKTGNEIKAGNLGLDGLLQTNFYIPGQDNPGVTVRDFTGDGSAGVSLISGGNQLYMYQIGNAGDIYGAQYNDIAKFISYTNSGLGSMRFGVNGEQLILSQNHVKVTTTATENDDVISLGQVHSITDGNFIRKSGNNAIGDFQLDKDLKTYLQLGTNETALSAGRYPYTKAQSFINLSPFDADYNNTNTVLGSAIEKPGGGYTYKSIDWQAGNNDMFIRNGTGNGIRYGGDNDWTNTNDEQTLMPKKYIDNGFVKINPAVPQVGNIDMAGTIKTTDNFKIPNTGGSGGNWVIDSSSDKFRFYNDVTGGGFELSGGTIKDVGGPQNNYAKEKSGVEFAGLNVTGNVNLGNAGSLTTFNSFGLEQGKPLFLDGGSHYLSTATNISLGSGDLSVRRGGTDQPFKPVLVQGDALPLTGGNIAGYMSVGQGEAITGFISDPNGYTGFAFGVPNFTSLQLRYQPNALGRGLQIYDPYDPKNVMEGNAEWKKVLVEDDAIEASPGTPQNASININGDLRVNGIYLGADKLDLNNTGYIDNVTSIFVRGEAGQISTANLGANRINVEEGHIEHAYFDVNSSSEGNSLNFFNGFVNGGTRDYSQLRTDNGGFQFINGGVNLMDINYTGGSKFYNGLEVSGSLKASGGVDLGYSTFSGASDAGGWSFGRFGGSGKFRFDFANADVPFLGGLLVSKGIEAGNGISANNGETTGAYNIPLVAYGSDPMLGLRSLGYGKSAGIGYSAGGLDFWIKGNSNTDLTATGIRPLRIADDGKAEFSNDVEISDVTKGIILKSPNGTRYRVTINDAGDFVKTAL